MTPFLIETWNSKQHVQILFVERRLRVREAATARGDETLVEAEEMFDAPDDKSGNLSVTLVANQKTNERVAEVARASRRMTGTRVFLPALPPSKLGRWSSGGSSAVDCITAPGIADIPSGSRTNFSLSSMLIDLKVLNH